MGEILIQEESYYWLYFLPRFLGFYPISWQYNQQTSVVLSSMEAEYMAACTAAQETMVIKIIKGIW